ncbi:MAG: hypothetical protein OK404_02855 [Thaumarchaeota archaeon]|nr:hypothetical protein [Nitrososphaerota archaeon]
MEAAASLRQTVTHLFDAVRFSKHAKETEEAARKAESDLEVELSKLESHTEEITNLLTSMKTGSDEAIKELARQIGEFLETAKAQAREKLERKTRDEAEDYKGTAATERDKALKSLEAYLAVDPLPIVELIVQARLTEGVYEARSRYECEGGIKYDFRLAAQNSKLFHQELMLSQLGHEIKVPVRFSRAVLKKGRVPGFERLDQYVLTNAETSGGKIRATFHKPGNEANLKVVTSGSKPEDFIGLEYSDHTEAVNVTNDPSLGAYIDLEVVRKAMGDLVGELVELSKKKVALLRLAFDGEESLENVNCESILDLVLRVHGPSYRGLVKELSDGSQKHGTDLSIGFIQERLKVLGDLSGPVSTALGLQSPR